MGDLCMLSLSTFGAIAVIVVVDVVFIVLGDADDPCPHFVNAADATHSLT
jgi:hypothetical protein